MKSIPMTIERFFELLPATKKFGPRLTRDGLIRYGYRRECPLSATYRVLTDRRTRMSPENLEQRFAFRDDRRRPESAVQLIVRAADDLHGYFSERRFTTRLRRRMLHTLGLKKKGER